jgi:hypothetical protein
LFSLRREILMFPEQGDEMEKDINDPVVSSVLGEDRHVEREFETGKDESWANSMTRTFDEYQHESLGSLRQLRSQIAALNGQLVRHFDNIEKEHLNAVHNNRAYVQKVLSDAQQNDNVRQNVANQALQNAVETANMVSKTAVRHSDIAIDRQWNVDETSTLTAKSGFQADSLASLVTKAVADGINSSK